LLPTAVTVAIGATAASFTYSGHCSLGTKPSGSAVIVLPYEISIWYRGRDSNSHEGLIPLGILSPVCLPFHHPGRGWRPRRDSHPRITVLQTVALLLRHVAIVSPLRRTSVYCNA